MLCNCYIFRMHFVKRLTASSVLNGNYNFTNITWRIMALCVWKYKETAITAWNTWQLICCGHTHCLCQHLINEDEKHMRHCGDTHNVFFVFRVFTASPSFISVVTLSHVFNIDVLCLCLKFVFNFVSLRVYCEYLLVNTVEWKEVSSLKFSAAIPARFLSSVFSGLSITSWKRSLDSKILLASEWTHAPVTWKNSSLPISWNGCAVRGLISQPSFTMLKSYT